MRKKRVGPYRVETELGSGGTGRVFLATVVGKDTEVPRRERVALKLVHPHLLETPRHLERFRREADLGQRVRHENVVATLDVGSVDVDGVPTPYLVMEHVEGRTLRALLADLDTVPEVLLREIALQVADGLAAVHEAGVVHRDLKPENVLVTGDHRVRIMDLGVARIVEQSISLTRQGEFAGTLPYAAPEQFRGDEIGPATDLYSLGVLLYELATGVNPFLHDDVSRVIASHLNDVPPPVTDRNPEVSPFLSELVGTLLAKDPKDRPASATEVRDRLALGEDSAWWAERERERRRRRARIPVVPIRRETGLHGRTDELAALDESWVQARSGEGRVVLIEGEAGIGKTRLADAFLARVGETDVHVLYGVYSPAGGAGGLSEALLSRFGEIDLEEALAPYLTATPRLLSDFAALVRNEPPAVGAALVSGDALSAVMCHLLRALAEEKPVVWVVEDLHFAEPDSQQIVLSMARALEGHRVLLLLTAEPGLPDDHLAHLGRLESFRRQTLSRLSPREVVSLLREALRSEELADRLGARIAFKSDGVPFFALEIVRGLREAGSIRRRHDGTCVATRQIREIEVPSAVRGLVEARLGRLAKEERAILDVAAVQGCEFDTRLIAEVLERKRVAVLQDLAEIERHTGIIRSGGRRCRFDHHLVQEVLVQDLLPELREEYHAMLAEALAEREDVAGRDPESLPGDVAVFLAEHHLHGSRPRQGLPYLRPALRHLERAYRNESVLDMAERALAAEGLLDGTERIEVLTVHARRLGLLGRREAQHESLEEARRLVEREKDPAARAPVYRSLGSHYWSVSRPEEAEDWLRRALELARESGDRAEEGRCLGQLGNVEENLGRYEDARGHYESAIATAREIGEPQAEATASGNLGVLLLNLGQAEEARARLEHQLRIAREAENREIEATAITNLALVEHRLGRLEETRELIERSLERFREMGDRQGEGLATGNLGEVLQHQGRIAEAMEQCRRCRSIAHEVGDRVGEGIAALNLGSLRATIGDLAGAEEDLEEARTVFWEVGARREETYAHHALGEVAESRGDRAEAERRYGAALERRRELAYTPGIATTLTARGRLLVDEGRFDEARPVLGEAVRLAEEIGDASTVALAAGHLARLPGGATADARRALERGGDEMSPATRMEVHRVLWRATGDPDELAEARRLLERLRDAAPPEAREAMIDRVPPHREILSGEPETGPGRSQGPS